MPLLEIRPYLAGILVLIIGACGGADVAEEPIAETTRDEPRVEAPEAPTTSGSGGTGSAEVSLVGEGVSITGSFPATLCGGAFMMGEGVSYQTQADGWQITVASERREAGEVPLNTPAGDINVVVAVNGPDTQFVRGPGNGGTLTITDDFRNAVADLELRSLVGSGTAQLQVAFTCDETA